MDSEYECEICRVQFASKATLKRHTTTKRHLQLAEAKEKGQAESYEELKVLSKSCQACDKVFCDKESLKKHLKTKRHLAKVKDAPAAEPVKTEPVEAEEPQEESEQEAEAEPEDAE